MPTLDGTGPKGKGSMTGKKKCKCNSSNSEGLNKPSGFGNIWGYGRNRWTGRGLKNGYKGGAV